MILKEIARSYEMVTGERTEALAHMYTRVKMESENNLKNEQAHQELERRRIYDEVNKERVTHIEQSETILREQLDETFASCNRRLRTAGDQLMDHQA